MGFVLYNKNDRSRGSFFLPMRTMRQRFMARFFDEFFVFPTSSIGVSRDVKLKRIQNEIPHAGTVKRRCEGICGTIKGGHKKEVRENVPWQEISYSSYNTRVALPIRCTKQRWN